eukprot:1157750-Pelagomonas_calceolata.AAC.3
MHNVCVNGGGKDLQELVIGLSGDASIRPNETLTLKENQKALVAASSGIPFSGVEHGQDHRALFLASCLASYV